MRQCETMRALGTWRMSTAVSASRSRWFLPAVTDVFGVDRILSLLAAASGFFLQTVRTW